MNVLKPPLLRVGNCAYRINPGDEALHSVLLSTTTTTTSYHQNHQQQSSQQQQLQQFKLDALEDEGDSISFNGGNKDTDLDRFTVEHTLEDDIDSRVQKSSNGQNFTASLNIPSALVKFIIGKSGETKKKIEFESKCRIFIPNINKGGPITIKGGSARDVSRAISKIEILSESSRKKVAFTHFISIPAQQSSVQEGFCKFKSEVLSRFSGERGIESSIFQNPAKLHITVEVLTVLSDEEMNAATRVFHECKVKLSSILGNDKKLIVQGLDYMNDDPTAVDVLYAKVRSASDDSRLQEMVDFIVTQFSNAGIIQKQYDHVKLHITVMNTIFRKDKTGTETQSKPAHGKHRETFNAQPILNEMHDFMFGEIDCLEIHLSQKHRVRCDGYYEPLTSFLLT